MGPLFAKTFESFAPRFTLDYKVSDDVFVYASASKGVRAGGFNTANAVSATGILASEVPYDEEENWTYELGFKTEWFDKLLMLNASYFHVDWKNAQVSSFTENPTAVNPNRIIRNIGAIKTDGFEAQARFARTTCSALVAALYIRTWHSVRVSMTAARSPSVSSVSVPRRPRRLAVLRLL